MRLYKCKGTNKKTYGFGCLEMISNEYGNRVFGIGKKCGCWKKWLQTKEGQSYIQSMVIPKAKETVRKKEKERFKSKKDSLETPDKYRSRVLQPNINKIIRLIDYGQNCIAHNKPPKKKNAGHFHSVGSNRTIALNLHNIFLQSEYSNQYKGGDDKNYIRGIIKVFSVEYYEYIDQLRQHPILKLSVDDMKKINRVALSIIKELDQNEKILTSEQRILYRNKYNEKLNIYNEGFKSFFN